MKKPLIPLLCLALHLLSWAKCTKAGSSSLSPQQHNTAEIESCAVENKETNVTTTTTRATAEETLICQIRTLHTALDLPTLTPLPPGTISKLSLICNDLLFFESSLSSPQLSPFKNLQELQITNCKLKTIENLGHLPQLKKLIITTLNSQWPQRSLTLSPSALEYLNNLEALELGYNAIHSLPSSLLCSLPQLEVLNLTHNSLTSVSDLISSSSSADPPCNNVSLKYLDLSWNSIQSLRTLINSETIKVNHNQIEVVEVTTFDNCGSLQKLNFSSNLLRNLPSALFRTTGLLKEVHFRNNSLESLPSDLFSWTEYLQYLDLSHNQLQNGDWLLKIFAKLFRLIYLNLSYNKLEKILPQYFENLFTLQHLDLSHNSITTLVDSPFSSLSALLYLNLGHNRLLTLQSITFKNLISLRKLTLDYNEIPELERDENGLSPFSNLTELQDLTLVRNSLLQVPENALKHLRKLRTLDLGENRISSVAPSSFQGLDTLYGLRLAGNLIEEIPTDFCANLPKLRALNLASNQLKKILTSAFRNCSEVRVLRLDSNLLSGFMNEVSDTGLVVVRNPQHQLDLPKLLWLNISGNALTSLDFSLLPKYLEWLDASSNSIRRIEELRRPSTFSYLRVLDLSHNQLTSLQPGSLPQGLEVIKLGFNSISKITPETFNNNERRLRRVELNSNQLRNLELKVLRLGNTNPQLNNQVNSNKFPVVEFLLAGNPFLCDCDMEWLTRVHTLASYQSLITIVDMEKIQCELSFTRENSLEPHKGLSEMKPSDFLCPYSSHCFALCHCCEFDYCDCQMTCPENCDCFHDDTWSSNVVNCGSRNQSSIPAALPMDSTQVYLDGNRIPVLKRHGFIGRKNLKSLYLNGSQIETISNKSFNGLHSLQVLHLEHNRITLLAGYEFEGLTRLQELYLNDNSIQSISNDTFLNLKSLEILNLQNNYLFTVKIWQLNLNRALVQIFLSGNRFQCENCEFLGLLHKWTLMENNERKLIDSSSMRCVWNRTGEEGPLVQDFNLTCGNDQQHYLTVPNLPSFWYFIFGGIFLLFVLISIVTLFIFGGKLNKCLLLSKLNFPFEDSPKSPPRKSPYDVMFIFSRNDTDFVRRISNTLEEKNYRVILVPDLARAYQTQSSATCTVAILSKNFFYEWNTDPDFRHQFSAILTKASVISPELKSVVVLSKDKLTKDEGTELTQNEFKIPKLRKRLILFESKKRFWEKLTFLLGPPSSPTPCFSHPSADDTGYGSSSSPASSLVYKTNFHSVLESSTNGTLNSKSTNHSQYYSPPVGPPPPHFLLKNPNNTLLTSSHKLQQDPSNYSSSSLGPVFPGNSPFQHSENRIPAYSHSLKQVGVNSPKFNSALYAHPGLKTGSSSTNNTYGGEKTYERSGRLTANSESSNNTSPPSNATDTTTVDRLREDGEPSPGSSPPHSQEGSSTDLYSYYNNESSYYHEPVMMNTDINKSRDIKPKRYKNSEENRDHFNGESSSEHLYFTVEETNPQASPNVRHYGRVQMQTFMV